MTNWAFIVGIGTFDNFEDLKREYPTIHARELRDILIESEDYEEKSIIMLSDDSVIPPTSVNIMQQLDIFLQSPKMNDTILIYFISHGAIGRSGKYYIYTKEFAKQNEDLIKRTTISKNYLEKQLRKHNHDKWNVFMIIDSCKDLDFRPLGDKNEAEKIPAGISFFESCTTTKKSHSFVDNKKVRSIFSHCLIETMKLGLEKPITFRYLVWHTKELMKKYKKKFQEPVHLAKDEAYAKIIIGNKYHVKENTSDIQLDNIKFYEFHQTKMNVQSNEDYPKLSKITTQKKKLREDFLNLINDSISFFHPINGTYRYVNIITNKLKESRKKPVPCNHFLLMESKLIDVIKDLDRLKNYVFESLNSYFSKLKQHYMLFFDIFSQPDASLGSIENIYDNLVLKHRTLMKYINERILHIFKETQDYFSNLKMIAGLKRQFKLVRNHIRFLENEFPFISTVGYSFKKKKENREEKKKEEKLYKKQRNYINRKDYVKRRGILYITNQRIFIGYLGNKFGRASHLVSKVKIIGTLEGIYKLEITKWTFHSRIKIYSHSPIKEFHIPKKLHQALSGYLNIINSNELVEYKKKIDENEKNLKELDNLILECNDLSKLIYDQLLNIYNTNIKLNIENGLH